MKTVPNWGGGLMKYVLFLFLVSTFVLNQGAHAGLFKKKKPPEQTEPAINPEPSEERKKTKPPEQPKTANIYNYQIWYPGYVEDYVKSVDASPLLKAAPAGGDLQCLPIFKNAIKKGVIDIRYALGYFDDSQGIEILYDGKNYGLSPSLDIEVFYVIRQFLTKKCEGGRVLCGFIESGDPTQGKVLLQKTLDVMGSQLLVNFTMTQASASENYSRNQSELKERQAFLTQQSEENYFGGIGVADIVFYNGHSRNGGGPDFNPPRLASDLHVDYNGYYKVQRPGIKRALAAINAGANKDSVMGFFSCFSESHFYSALMKANPKQRLILSSDTVNYLDSLLASMGYLEGLLQGQCGQNLADIAKQTDSVKAGFTGFQIK
jgi:hypothetical protein